MREDLSREARALELLILAVTVAAAGCIVLCAAVACVRAWL
jgi:hypothetical protein